MVGDRVVPALVVPGVLERRPDLLDVGDVAVVEGAQEVSLDQLAKVVVGREEHVEGDLAAAELGHRLVHVPVGRDLDLDVVLLVLLLEVLDDLLVDVLAPVVDLQGGALLGGEAVGDACVGRDRPGHGVVGAGQLGPAGAGGGPAGVTLPAGRQQDPAGDGQGRGGGAGEEGSAADRHGCLLPCSWTGNYNKLNVQSIFGVAPRGSGFVGQSYPMSEADREIQAAARALADGLQPHEVEAELHGGELPDGLLEEHRRRVAELGFEAINMPKELGGGGFSAFQQVLVQEQIGRVTNALGWVVHIPASWLPKVATPEQLERWVVPTIRGERRECYAITEEGAGSDVDAISATATRDGDGYLLRGVKWHVTSFNEADHVFFQGKLAGGPNAGAHAMFVVDLDP